MSREADVEVWVVGPGALGCALAAELTLSRRRVGLVDHRVDRVRRLNDRGLVWSEVNGVERPLTVPLLLNTEVDPCGARLIVVAAKSYQLRAAVSWLSAHEPLPPILVLANGVGNREQVVAELPEAAVVVGLVYFGARLVCEGNVVVTAPRRIVVGGPGQAVAQTTEVFADTGIRCEVSDDIDREIWRKAIVNAAINPLTAIHRVRNGALPEMSEACDLMCAIVAEGATVCSALGIPLKTEDLYQSALQTCVATAENVSSMRRDVELGRPTEIAALNGAIADRAAALGLPAPVNRQMVERINSLAVSEPRPPRP